MPRRFLALVTVAVLAAAACGDSNGEGAEPDEGSQDAPAGDALAVKAVDFAFEPSELEVEPGSSVTIELTNGGDVAHTFTVSDADVDVTVDVAGTATASFDAPDGDATLDFMCRFHSSQMTGTITVGAGGADSGGGSDDEKAEDPYDY